MRSKGDTECYLLGTVPPKSQALHILATVIILFINYSLHLHRS